MSDVETPDIMINAREDMASTVNGKFSPEDWERILELAKTQLLTARREFDEVVAWQAVVRDFHAKGYWGFVPNYRPPKIIKPKNLGYQFIWLLFGSLTIMKVAILWFGQVYSRSDEARDKWTFFAVLALVFGNILLFLWRNRNYKD